MLCKQCLVVSAGILAAAVRMMDDARGGAAQVDGIGECGKDPRLIGCGGGKLGFSTFSATGKLCAEFVVARNLRRRLAARPAACITRAVIGLLTAWIAASRR